MSRAEWSKLRGALRAFGAQRILVIGDLMLDHYVTGTVNRVSPEAPVPVLRVEEEQNCPGGAANVAVNLARMGAQVTLLGVVGDDESGDELLTLLKKEGIDATGILIDPQRRTLVKQRLMARRHHMLRLDWESDESIDSELLDKVYGMVPACIEQVDAVICSDYAKGLLDGALVKTVVDAAERRGIRTFVDPKAADLTRYHGIHYITPNATEFSRWSGFKVEEDGALRERLCQQMEANGWRAMFITRGERGATVVEPDAVSHIEGHRQEMTDIVGAGDTFIAALALALTAGLSAREAASLANVAASIVVTKAGTSYAEAEEIDQKLRYLEDWSWEYSQPRLSAGERLARSKVCTVDEAHEIVAAMKQGGKRIVFTNGCFDILHPGHLSLLQRARQLGDFLVVALNSDVSVRALKGHSRPHFREQERLTMLSAFPFVDLLLLFDEITPIMLIEHLLPDVLVKGGDYLKHEVVGWDIVEANGGEVITLELLPGHSTTRILQRIASD